MNLENCIGDFARRGVQMIKSENARCAKLFAAEFAAVMLCLSLSGCGRAVGEKAVMENTLTDATEEVAMTDEAIWVAEVSVEATEESLSEEGTKASDNAGTESEEQSVQLEEPVAELESTPTPKPAKPPEPSATPKPEKTPEPAKTPEPTPEPTPAPTPEPTSEPVHVHSFTTQTVSEATCKEPKKVKDVCSCGYSENERSEGAALGHDLDGYYINRDSTCFSPGTAGQKCTRCGLYVYNITIPEKEHDLYETVVFEGNCRDARRIEIKCHNCSYMDEREDSEYHANDHVWVTETYQEWSDEAFAMVDVSRVCCKVCNKVKPQE